MDGRSGHRYLEEEVNQLKLENALLRRDAVAINSGCIYGPTSSCQVCPVLQFQIDRLMKERTEARRKQTIESPPSFVDPGAYLAVINKERERRYRMESIIERQQKCINELLQTQDRRLILSPGFDSPIHHKADSSHALPCSDFSGISLPAQTFAPPWEIDIDDLNRQLCELNENVHRVELASSKLHSTGSRLREGGSVVTVTQNLMHQHSPADFLLRKVHEATTRFST